jgi:methylenetetrahydrofolate dehydrogenase (NADP+)/methenyltetrahydrofolate cyclohydrolase
MAGIINGKMIAEGIRREIKAQAAELKAKSNLTIKLAVVLVGDDPGSQIYVRNKERACHEVGIEGMTIRLSSTTNQRELNETIAELNRDKAVDGILVQLPLPKPLSPEEALLKIAPEKDVDGLHPLNLGKLLRGEVPFFLPCTPSGCMELILSTGQKIEGKEAVIVGRSNIVGKPMALMLLKENATVTVCHSKTKDLAAVCRRADILVAAIGVPEFIKGEMVKAGATIVDVGMNRLPEGLVGDVEFKSASQKAGYITPVPGGVGPMTIAMLLKNTLLAAKRKTV